MSTTESRHQLQDDVAAQLANLKHERNNRLPRLPSNTTIARRPILHSPVAPPTAGSRVQKVVYVSRRTPIMSAVKRVKKFLHEIEKRALQSADVSGAFEKHAGKDGELERRLQEASKALQKNAEEVLVKASGRAMEQALRVGEWFRSREQEVMCKVEVRTGSVVVVDDIVELEEHRDITEDEEEARLDEGETTKLVAGETTLELLGNLDESREVQNSAIAIVQETLEDQTTKGQDEGSPAMPDQKRKRRKRKRKRTYDPDDLPEARLRHVKTVEVAISLSA